MLPAPKTIEGARAFAQAIVDTVHEPLLVLDGELRVIVASRSYYGFFRTDAAATEGKLFEELGDCQWKIPALHALLERVAPHDTIIEGFETERDFPVIGVRTMLLNARKVFYARQFTETILVAIEDVTDRRAIEHERDDLLRQRDVLLQEMQHRIANSLQIIASILLMKAKSVNSDETRAHLEEAHTRVLAVAAVQRHLRVSTGPAAIQLEPYFVQLCASLAGAMIRNEAAGVKLKVEVAEGSTTSGVAVSLGLIVTELVINALKHAFPVDKNDSTIIVSYVAKDADWTLNVSDNGVGAGYYPDAPAKAGLGTSIIGALAEQLDAHVSTTSSAAGMSVSITHTPKRKAA